MILNVIKGRILFPKCVRPPSNFIRATLDELRGRSTLVNKTRVTGGWKWMLRSSVTAPRDSETWKRGGRRRLIKICGEAIMLATRQPRYIYIYQTRFWSIRWLTSFQFQPRRPVAARSPRFITLLRGTMTRVRSILSHAESLPAVNWEKPMDLSQFLRGFGMHVARWPREFHSPSAKCF